MWLAWAAPGWREGRQEMNSEPARELISICDDDGLRYSRELILRHAGYNSPVDWLFQ